MNYVISSPFAESDEVMVNGLTLDYYKMLEEFYEAQKPYSELDSHRRLFHMVLSARPSKHIQRSLDEAAKYFLDYMTMKDHQVLLVPHYGSEDNAYNYHWHAVVNVKSYSTGQTLLDQYATHKEICDYLSEHQEICWDYKYHTDKRVVANQYF